MTTMRSFFKASVCFVFFAFVANSRADESSHSTSHSNSSSEAYAKARPPCPRAIQDLIVNRDNSWWQKFKGYENPADCTENKDVGLRERKEFAPDVIEGVLQSSLGSRLEDMPSDFVSKCLSDFEAANPSGKKMTPNEKRGVIADYYYLMKRMTNQSRANLEAINSINLILGKSGQDSVPTRRELRSEKLSSPLLPGTEKTEAALKQCPAPKVNPTSGRTESMEQMITQTQNALNALAQVDAKLQSTGNTNPSQKKELQVARELILNSAPWLRGSVAQKLVKSNGKQNTSEMSNRDYVGQVLSQQLSGNRNAMIRQMKEIGSAAECIHSSNANCLGEKMDFFDTLPAYDRKWVAIPGVNPENENSLDAADAVKLSGARSAIAGTECRFQLRKDQRTNAGRVDFFAQNLAITAVTGGLGAYIEYSNVMVSAGRAAQISGMAKLARAALIASDVGFIGLGANQAWTVCDKALEGRLSSNPALMGQGGQPSCNNSSDHAQLMTELKECYIQAALAGVGVIAAIPGNLALLRSPIPAATRLRSMGFNEAATEDIMRGLANSERTPFRISQITRPSPDKNILVLDTLEKLGPNFAKGISTASHRQALGEALGEMQRYFGNEWKPAQAAEFIRSISSSGEDGLMTLSTAFQKADQILQETPSLGKMGALREYLKSVRMNEADAQKLMTCLSTTFK